jgi:biotin synthase
MSGYREILERVAAGGEVPCDELVRLIERVEDKAVDYAGGLAREVTEQHFGGGVYLRGLVEVGSHCTGGCYYCGLRAENRALERYELSSDEILGSCREGYELGFRSFVLQGGERHDRMDSVADVVRSIKGEMPTVAVTLSLGEQSRECYEVWRNAGADRYLLRHETASREHYARLHPSRMSYDSRQRCLVELRELGYQIGAGFMVGSPYQEAKELAGEVEFLGRLRPEMVGIGPFLPQSSTPFADKRAGSVSRTLLMISLARLTLPKALIPATTALASRDEDGTVRGIMAGANVVMPNLTPLHCRAGYAIYDGKKTIGSEAAEGVDLLSELLHKVGREAVMSRGDHPDFIVKEKNV